MTYRELAILLPCHSLEDFPVHHEGDDAEGLLAAWTALWHPALLASAEAMPTWHRVEEPPESCEELLLVAPSVAASEIAPSVGSRLKKDCACFIRRKTDRQEILDLALEKLPDEQRAVAPELAADFLALGFAYLQVELLTHHMRYSSHVDEGHFRDGLVEAAQAALRGEAEVVRENLGACFDVLAEQRDHYYPVDAHLIDLTLVAETTIGPSLRGELARQRHTNLLISGATLAELAEREPESLSALKQALAEGRCTLIGGEYHEVDNAFRDAESLLSGLRRGLAAYESILGSRPVIYGRRNHGLSPTLPQVLDQFGFEGALHASFDGSPLPEGTQSRTRWEGYDGSTIDALARSPQDASKPETFLTLSTKIGESMDMDHVATVCLAHWPSAASHWREELEIIARYAPALGKFTPLDEYLRDTDHAGQYDRFDADQYRSAELQQAVIRGAADPISGVAGRRRRRASAQAAQNLAALAAMTSGAWDGREAARLDQLDQAECREMANPNGGEPSGPEESESLLAAAAGDFSQGLPRSEAEPETAYLVANPLGVARRELLDVSQLEALPNEEKPVYAADDAAGAQRAVIDTPPFGFAWVTAAAADGKKRSVSKPLAEDNLLRNEYFEARVSPTTGALVSVHDFHSRGNRLSQQLAMRLGGAARSGGDPWSHPEEQAQYSVMAADSVEVLRADSVIGEIESRGRLLDKTGRELARYQQTFRVTRARRVLEIDIELEPLEEPRADPWKSYFCSRVAWAAAGANLWRGVHWARRPTLARKIVAPEYLEIDLPDQSTTILSGGIAHHRAVGDRMLDTILLVRGETRRKFRLGLAFDTKQPWNEALMFLTPPTAVQEQSAPPASARHGWLFHIDARNVMTTHLEPIIEEERVAGFRMRLIEVAGRRTTARLSGFRNLSWAGRVTFLGRPIADCELEGDGDSLSLEMAPHQWVQVEGRW